MYFMQSLILYLEDSNRCSQLSQLPRYRKLYIFQKKTKDIYFNYERVLKYL